MAGSKIALCIWFDGQAEEAANFYTSLFPDSEVEYVMRSPIDWPGGKVGDVLLVGFSIAGQKYQALNGGPQQEFNERISISVSCEDQAEVDRYWDALTANGGSEIMCGWLKDKFGVRWQIVPEPFTAMLLEGDDQCRKRAMDAMGAMKKLDLAQLRSAFEG
ncbi:VOC family protein [Stieleria sp. JC731]|uniref:VOC family protein n=1 Tax=Pirellulaceae TaxID=2691357 RepID=UPI001E50BB45|nr:VOC family protein [Stieleria sp. JC731]MCC9602346.1 VOC family protein [Stieleria sp. JC731]